MAENAISEFFRAKDTRRDSSAAELGRKQRSFLAAWNELYLLIEEYLRSAGSAVMIKYADVIVEEPREVKYTAREMSVQTRDEQVVFTPKGFSVYGASGRVDVKGERGLGMLILQPGDRLGNRAEYKS